MLGLHYSPLDRWGTSDARISATEGETGREGDSGREGEEGDLGEGVAVGIWTEICGMP